MHTQTIEEGIKKKKVPFNSTGYDSLLIVQAAAILVKNQLQVLVFINKLFRNEKT
jgi:hypothetical protein